MHVQVNSKEESRVESSIRQVSSLLVSRPPHVIEDEGWKINPSPEEDPLRCEDDIGGQLTMMANLWKNACCYYLHKHKYHFGEISSFHWICEDSSRGDHSALKFFLPHKLGHEMLQLHVVKVGLVSIIWNFQELCNPDLK